MAAGLEDYKSKLQLQNEVTQNQVNFNGYCMYNKLLGIHIGYISSTIAFITLVLRCWDRPTLSLH